MEIKGQSPIHPLLFLAGKVCGYFAWLVLVLALAGVVPMCRAGRGAAPAAWILLVAGMALIVVSSLTLGPDLRIGLPTGETRLHTRGIYRLSRNPMYLGLHLITLVAMFCVLQWWLLLPGFLSIWVYHRIILAEEQFLAKRFGSQYRRYRQEVRRYL